MMLGLLPSKRGENLRPLFQLPCPWWAVQAVPGQLRGRLGERAPCPGGDRVGSLCSHVAWCGCPSSEWAGGSGYRLGLGGHRCWENLGSSPAGLTAQPRCALWSGGPMAPTAPSAEGRMAALSVGTARGAAGLSTPAPSRPRPSPEAGSDLHWGLGTPSLTPRSSLLAASAWGGGWALVVARENCP